MDYGTYLGQPVNTEAKAQEAWEALLGQEQSRAVWIGEEMELALSGVETAKARLNTFAWSGLGACALATAVYHFAPELPKLPVRPSTVLMIGSVGVGAVNLWLTLGYQQLKAKAKERIDQHRKLLVNVAKGELRESLVDFIKEADLVDDDLIAHGADEMGKKRTFAPSTAYSVQLEPVGFVSLVAEIVAANLN